MLRVGLTGSIGMGKTATARMFAEAGLPVFDADAAVHALYAKGGAAVSPVEAAFPGVAKAGAIDRAALAQALAADADGFRRLEAIVHPLVTAERARFIAEAEASGALAAVFDIPLLFETGQAGEFDAIVVASAPEDVQRARVLARPGMTEEKFAAILARQTPDAEKRARADFVIDTSGGFDAARTDVQAVIAALKLRANAAKRS